MTDVTPTGSGSPAMRGVRRPPASALTILQNELLRVEVLLDRGADIYALIDRETGIDVLFKSPWGWRDPAAVTTAGTDEAGWLATYAGGWQILLPNAGEPRRVAGALRGYHGEAAVIGWSLIEHTASILTAQVSLATAPLHARRTLTLDGNRLTVQTKVGNLSDIEVGIMWVEHPAFGAPFIDERTRLHTNARTVLTDADDPGTILQADTAYPTTEPARVDGHLIDLVAIGADADHRKIFAALTDFDGPPFYVLSSPTVGFDIRIDWSASTHPHAWLWQESRATAGFPWFRRAYALAVEPASVLPGNGTSTAGYERGRLTQLRGGETIEASVTVTRAAAG